MDTDRYPLHHRSEVDFDARVNRRFAHLDDHRQLAGTTAQKRLHRKAGSRPRLWPGVSTFNANATGCCETAIESENLFSIPDDSEESTMSDSKVHPSCEHHHLAAAHHVAAAYHHLQAIDQHDKCNPGDAAVHADAANKEDGKAHQCSMKAAEHAHK